MLGGRSGVRSAVSASYTALPPNMWWVLWGVAVQEEEEEAASPLSFLLLVPCCPPPYTPRWKVVDLCVMQL